MAIFSLAATVISRGKGQSCVAAAAYRARAELTDERTGEDKDYTRRAGDLVFEGIFAPKNAPEWARDRAQLWNHVEAFEKHHKAQLAYEYRIALPHELGVDHARYALQDWIKENFTRKGLIADAVIHQPNDGRDERNLHAHVMVVMRPLDGTEFLAKKERQASRAGFEAARLAELEKLRENWAHHANRHLERHGHDARIDHRSLSAQGLAAEPTVHLGWKASEIERRGGVSERGEINRQIAAENARRASEAANENEAAPPEPTLTAERMAADEQEETRRRDRPRARGMDAEIATALWQLSKTSPGLVGAIFVTPGGEAWRREDFPLRFALDREALAPEPRQEPGQEAGQPRDPTAERRIWVERLREAAGPRPDAPHIREGQEEARDHADRLRDEARDAALFGGDPDRAARLREEADGILARDGLDRDGRPVPRPDPVAERRIWVERLREAAGPRPDDPRMRERAAPPPREAQAGGAEAEATPLAGASPEAAHLPSREAGHSPDPARTPEPAPPGPERSQPGAAAVPSQTWLRKALDAARERLDTLGDRLDSAFGRIRERFLRQADRQPDREPEAKPRPEARPEVRETHRAEPRPPPVPEASRDPPPRSRSPIADEMLAAGRKAAAEREASLTPQQREAQREVRAARHREAAHEREIRGPVREIGGDGAGGAANGAGRSRYRHQAAPVTLRDGRRPYRSPARAAPARGGGAQTGAKPDGWEDWPPSQRLAWTLAQQWIAARRREFDL